MKAKKGNLVTGVVQLMKIFWGYVTLVYFVIFNPPLLPCRYAAEDEEQLMDGSNSPMGENCTVGCGKERTCPAFNG